jgi:hypothetical protein
MTRRTMMRGDGRVLAFGAVALVAAAGLVRKMGSRNGEKWPDLEVSLEYRCADDRGAGYKDESKWTEEDRIGVEDYEETRNAQQELEYLLDRSGLPAYADVLDTDDRDSRHTDCYVRFNLPDIGRIAELLDEVGLAGDILDLPDDLDDEDLFSELVERIRERFGWEVE